MRWNRLGCVLTVLTVATACGGATDADSSPATDVTPSSPSAVDCVVRLHGKGGRGDQTRASNDIVEVSPDGNAEGWNGLQWIYFPDDRFEEARRIVQSAIDQAGCARVVVNGFSNGAAFAASLVCRGELFDGRVIGYVIDDPVPDRAVEGCNAPAATPIVLYWTGGLDGSAVPGADCAAIDWTCDGGSMLGIEAYAAELGVPVTPSAFTDHLWFRDAPEIGAWLQ